MMFNSRYKIAIYNYPLFDPRLKPGHDFCDEVLEGDETSSVYIHIPFCDITCPFCLYSKKKPDHRTDIDEYVKSLKKEIFLYSKKKHIQSLSIASIFVGGGTPSVLTSSQMEGLLQCCREYLPLSKDVEITWEFNPLSSNEEKLRVAKDSGVSRVSTGIQSFDRQYRRILGLVPSLEETMTWVESARACGFVSVGADLMFGIPGQSYDDWGCDLDMALNCGLSHLSIYELALISGSPIEKAVRNKKLPPQHTDETMDEFFFMTQRKLRDAGYFRHTLNEYDQSPNGCGFWNHVYDGYGDNLAFGLSSYGHTYGRSYQNESTLKDYHKKVHAGQLPIKFISSQVDLIQEMERTAVLSILRGYIDLEKFERKYQHKFVQVFGDVLDDLIAAKYLIKDEAFLKVTEQGMPWVRNIAVEFMASTFKESSSLVKRISIGKHQVPPSQFKRKDKISVR